MMSRHCAKAEAVLRTLGVPELTRVSRRIQTRASAQCFFVCVRHCLARLQCNTISNACKQALGAGAFLDSLRFRRRTLCVRLKRRLSRVIQASPTQLSWTTRRAPRCVCVCVFAVLRVLLGAFARFGSQLDACVSDSQLDAFFLPALFSFLVFEIFRQRNSASVTNAAGNT